MIGSERIHTFKKGRRSTLLKHRPTGKCWRGWADDIPAAMRNRGWLATDCMFRYPDEKVWRKVTTGRKIEETAR